MLRKARENIRWMVVGGLCANQIRSYFLNGARWWTKVVSTWTLANLIEQFISRCWVFTPIDIAISVSTLYLTESSPRTTCGSSVRVR